MPWRSYLQVHARDAALVHMLDSDPQHQIDQQGVDSWSLQPLRCLSQAAPPLPALAGALSSLFASFSPLPRQHRDSSSRAFICASSPPFASPLKRLLSRKKTYPSIHPSRLAPRLASPSPKLTSPLLPFGHSALLTGYQLANH